MREIKFRAWDKRNKCMSYSKDINSALVSNLLYAMCGTEEQLTQDELDNFELMQYTGLKDKNGVEIYEGDLLVVELDWGYGLAKIYSKVYYDDKEATFKAKAINSHEDTYLYNMPYIEVIGNIYEHAHLLDNK